MGAWYEPGPVVGVPAVLLTDRDHLTAEGKGGEDVPCGKVEVQGGDRECAVIRSEPEFVLHRLDGVDDGTVRDLDAFGQPGGSGGEEHVGGQLGVRLSHRPGGLLQGVLQEEDGGGRSSALRWRCARSVSTADGSATAWMRARRTAGCSTPTGAYAAPAASTPSTAVIWSAPLGRVTVTVSPSRTPWRRRREATCRASRAS